MPNRRTARKTLTLIGGYLSYPEETSVGKFYHTVSIEKDSGKEWVDFLNRDDIKGFSYEREFTVQREARQNTKQHYWIAYKRINGKLKRKHIGRAEDVTADKLRDVAQYFKLAATDWRSKYAAFPVGMPSLLDIVEDDYARLHGHDGRYKGCIIEKQGNEYFARRNGETLAYFQSWDKLIDFASDYVASGKPNMAMLRQK